MSRVSRVGVVQWSMEGIDSEQHFLDRIDFQIEALSGYGCQFVLFPEFFGIPLLAEYDRENPSQSIRELALRTPTLVRHISRKALKANVNVIAGSFPAMVEGRLQNVAYLCGADGSIEAQAKIHVTPNERASWDMEGGDALRVFDTPHGRIAIVICYDIEFPELGRILADKGVDIVFVPSWTDVRHAWQRVCWCARARAIENECYVVLSGSVGTLTQVPHADFQYSRSGVFTPSDLVFPPEGVLAEADANVAQTIIADLDLDKLAWLRRDGAVRNGRDRRRDVCEVRWTGR